MVSSFPKMQKSSASFSQSIRNRLRLKNLQAQAKNFCRVLDIRVTQIMRRHIRQAMQTHKTFDSVRKSGRCPRRTAFLIPRKQKRRFRPSGRRCAPVLSEECCNKRQQRYHAGTVLRLRCINDAPRGTAEKLLAALVSPETDLEFEGDKLALFLVSDDCCH